LFFDSSNYQIIRAAFVDDLNICFKNTSNYIHLSDAIEWQGHLYALANYQGFPKHATFSDNKFLFPRVAEYEASIYFQKDTV